jgi:hypothetical protein
MPFTTRNTVGPGIVVLTACPQRKTKTFLFAIGMEANGEILIFMNLTRYDNFSTMSMEGFGHVATSIGEQLQNPNHLNPDSMIPIVKKCPNLVKDKYGEWCCKGTHVCYKTVCNSTLFETVLHLGASIHTITN